MAMAIVLGALSLVLSLGTTITLGRLAWWWMAHAMRPATAAAPA